MRALLVVALVLVFSSVVMAQGYPGMGNNPNNHYVNPYQTNQGVYVPGHYQTNPNNTQYDNYGTRGNVNPYTGQPGTRTPRY